MNNNNYKWETVGKSKFYTDGTTCTDIEVMDNACLLYTSPSPRDA